MKKLILLVALILGAAFFVNEASAQHPSKEAMAWFECAEQTLIKTRLEISFDPSKFMLDVCEYVNAEPGQECEAALKTLDELGFLEERMTRFALDKIVIPTCGQPPRPQ